MALIAQYLLHLAENSHANELHNRSPQSALDQMKAFGLDKRAACRHRDGRSTKNSGGISRGASCSRSGQRDELRLWQRRRQDLRD